LIHFYKRRYNVEMSFFLFTVAVFSASLAIVGNLVNQNVPKPYMDEIFHVPQAQQYCSGNFTSWDPKITTLPGLYLVSVGIVSPLNSIASMLTGEQPDKIKTCSTMNLRSLNVIFGMVNLALIYCITSQLHGLKQDYHPKLAILNSLNLSLLPVLFMFNFLYYTDVVSTMMVLLTYSLHLSGSPYHASLSGLFSVICRQTNIVWVFLVAALAAGQTLTSEVKHHQARTKHPPTIALTTYGQTLELIHGLGSILKSPWRAAKLTGRIVVECLGYILVGVGFLLFIKLNGGIVVGDRSAHVAVIHLPQLLYFSAFFSALSFAFTLPALDHFLTFLNKNKLTVIVAVIVMGLVVEFNTLAHPYLLADNRHATFYIWRRLLMRHWSVKFLVIPLYLASVWSIARCLRKSDLIFKLVFPVCLAASLVPQALLEFRYFIVPFLLVRLQVRPSSFVKLFVELIFLLLVNTAVFYLFLYKPFKWDNAPNEWQRFMW